MRCASSAVERCADYALRAADMLMLPLQDVDAFRAPL